MATGKVQQIKIINEPIKINLMGMLEDDMINSVVLNARKHSNFQGVLESQKLVEFKGMSMLSEGELKKVVQLVFRNKKILTFMTATKNDLKTFVSNIQKIC